MDRDDAFLIYLASIVAVINIGLVLSGVSNLGPYLGLYSLAYVTGAFFARPRNQRSVWAIAAALVASFLGYSALTLVGWIR